MPWKKHPCAHPGCTRMVNKKAVHCQKHRFFTSEHRANISKGITGRVMSPESRRKIGEANSNGGSRVRDCEYCHKAFEVDKPSRKQRFCSSACGYANRRGERAFNWRSDMPQPTCRVCGKQFRVPARTMAHKRFTCSYTCKAIWQKTRQKNKATNIERATEKAIKNRGWAYETQVTLCNVTIADFYLPDAKIAIFCDGDYWHSLPGKAERNHRQTEVLRAAGYVVYRFLGSEILQDVESCLDCINYSVQDSQPVLHLRQLTLPIVE